jgi:hypothetical protein
VGLLFITITGCAAGKPARAPALDDAPPLPTTSPAMEPDPFAGLPSGSAQLDILCARGGQDGVTLKLCTTPRPQLSGLADLQRALGLAFADPGGAGNGSGGNPGFVLSGHSSSLVARSVTALNPRAFVFTPPPLGADKAFVAMTFTRGEQIVELATRDPSAAQGKGALAFYLVKYEQACNQTGSCTWGDVLTPETERNWKSWTLYEDDDLKDTVLDCLHCHQPGGPSGAEILRMQEHEDPWTHFFRRDRPGGAALIADYVAMHAGEDYGPIPAALVPASDPAQLAKLVDAENDGALQPNPYPTAAIEHEVEASVPGQPQINVPRGLSPSWQAVYERAAAGLAIAVPYHDAKVTDPTQVARLTAIYKRVASGAVAPAYLPDIRDAFLDAALIDLTFRPTPGQDARAILTQMCHQCHNSALDASLSRARFNVDLLDSLGRLERDLAVQRLLLPETDVHRMPPVRFRALTPNDIATVVAFLQQ